MKKILILLPLILLLAACKQSLIDVDKCPDIACTENFASVTIQFTKGGQPITVINYSAVNQRTHDTLSTPENNPLYDTFYVVTDDSDVRNLAETGDSILVSGTDSISSQTKTAVVKVSGGKCACHINKMSGPEQITFD